MKVAETCEARDTLVSNSGIAKGMPNRAQALPNNCWPCHLACKRYSKEQLNILLKQSVNIICNANIYSHSCIVTLSLRQ